jgi:hypothetical protein
MKWVEPALHVRGVKRGSRGLPAAVGCRSNLRRHVRIEAEQVHRIVLRFEGD